MRNVVLGIAAGAVVGGIVAVVFSGSRAEGQDSGPLIGGRMVGVIVTGGEDEVITGRLQRGASSIPKEAKIHREIVQVPESYGNLVSVQGREFWFQDKDGVVRNVICSVPIVKMERIAGK